MTVRSITTNKLGHLFRLGPSWIACWCYRKVKDATAPATFGTMLERNMTICNLRAADVNPLACQILSAFAFVALEAFGTTVPVERMTTSVTVGMFSTPDGLESLFTCLVVTTCGYKRGKWHYVSPQQVPVVASKEDYTSTQQGMKFRPSEV